MPLLNLKIKRTAVHRVYYGITNVTYEYRQNSFTIVMILSKTPMGAFLFKFLNIRKVLWISENES